jgi:soluble lytic murein transglycosylase
MMAALRAQDWAAADMLALQEQDSRLALALVRFIRLLKPGQAAPAEIAAFIKTHADWPDRAVLAKRLGEAVVADADDASVLPVCEAQHFGPAPLARCASAFEAAGQHAQAAAAARAAWAGGLDAGADFLARWGAVLTPDDEWLRFEFLSAGDPAAAARQVPRLDPDHRQAALARLAWRRDAPDALTQLALVPGSFWKTPAVLGAPAPWRRRWRCGAVPGWQRRRQWRQRRAARSGRSATRWRENS